MTAFALLSHAKLNLALEIVGKRPDGFHELRTIFERIDLADRLTFSSARGPEITITCDHPGVPCDERNLVHKAARILMEKEGISRGARIHIQKRIPVAAGLAGGSSNAATALVGLDRLWGLKLSREALIACAKMIGSDVAFFLHERSFALGTGRGEKIRPLEIKNKFWHVLITPKAPLLTKDVYQTYAAHFLKPGSSARDCRGARLTRQNDDVTMLASSLKKGDIVSVQKLLFNDLEGPIGRIRPGLLKLKERLKRISPIGVCFSGSGPSIFVLTETKAEAEGIARRFRKTYTQVVVTRTQ